MLGKGSKRRSKSMKMTERTSNRTRQGSSSFSSDDLPLKKRLRASTLAQSSLQRSRGSMKENKQGQEGITQQKHLSTLVLSKTMECRSKDNVHHTFITDVRYVDIGSMQVLVVTDYGNVCVKSFFNKNGQPCSSILPVETFPQRIAKLEENRIAVTLPYSFRIEVITVGPELSLFSSMSTSKQYTGVTSLTPTTLAAGNKYPPGVDILDRSGNVLQSISPVSNGQVLIDNPLFLRTTKKGNILVSDHGTKSLLCLTQQGDVVFNYSDSKVRCPAGITVTGSGDILVVDDSAHTIIHISESGQFVREILSSHEGLDYRNCLDYSEREKSCVTFCNGFLEIFTFE